MKKIKLEEKENIICSNQVILLDKPSYVYFSLRNNGNFLPLVKKGDYVYQEETIALQEYTHFPLFTSISGIVENVDMNNIIIRNDFKNRVREYKTEDYEITSYTKEEISNTLFQLGIQNSIPTELEPYKIFSKTIIYKTLIINALKGEAYLYLQTFLLKMERKELLELIEALIEIYNFEEVLIVVPKDQKLLLEEWKKCINDTKIKVIEKEEYYALSNTKELVRAIKKITLKKEAYEQGIIVFNVSTMLAIYNALKYRRPQIKVIAQFTGNMWKNNCYMELRIGTSLEEAIKELSYKRAKEVLLLQGGIVDGNVINIKNTMVTTQNPIFSAWKVTKEVKKESCIRCGKCIKACPINLHPALIIEAITKKKNLNRFELERCIECGLCSYVCPSNINVFETLKNAKEKQK